MKNANNAIIQKSTSQLVIALNKLAFTFFLVTSTLLLFAKPAFAVTPPPTITTSPSLSVAYDNAYSYSIVASSDADLATTLTAPTLPAWLSISNDGQSQATPFGDIPAGKSLTGVAGDDNGNIYAVTSNGTEIYKMASDGTTTLWRSGLLNSSVYALHIANGYLYIPRHYNATQSITRIPLADPAAAEETFASISGGALSLTDKDGWIYAAEINGYKIYRIDEATGNTELFLSSAEGLNVYPFGMTFDESGNIFIATWSNKSILKWDGSAMTTVLSDLPAAVSSIRIDAQGNFYLSMNGGGVRKYNNDFSTFEVVSITATDNIWSLSLTSSGALVYAKFNTNEVYRLQTGAILTGTPGKADLGEHPVVIRASNDAGSTEQAFTITVIDNIPPEVTALTPLDGATDVVSLPSLALTFDEAVSLGETGTFALISAGTTLKTYDLSVDADRALFNLSADKRTLSINVTESLPASTSVGLAISQGFVKDASDNDLVEITSASGDWDFTTANPTVAFYSSSSNGLETQVSVDLQVDLSGISGQTVTVDYTLTGSATGADYSLANGTLTIAAGDANNSITLAGIVNDLLEENNETIIVTLSNPSNASLGTNTVHTYTINDNDATNPSVVLSSNATPQSVSSFDLTVTFSEAVNNFVVGDITLSGGSLSNFTTLDAGITYTATVTPPSASSVTFDVAANVAQDLFGHLNTAATQLSVTLDNKAPTLSSSMPTNGASELAITTPSITLTFDEDVLAQNTGANGISLLLMSNSSVLETIKADSATIVANVVTVNFTSTLIPNTQYGVLVGSNAFADAATNLYAGLSASNLRFTTANDAPITANDSATADEDSSVQIDVLSNDSDSEGYLLPSSTTVTTQPSNGSTSVNTANGVITYTPTVNFNGSDSFSYRVNDSQGGVSNITTVTVAINALNDIPVLSNDSVSTAEDTPVSIDVLANDMDIDTGDVISNIVIVSAASNGTTTLVDGKISYQPNSDYFGSDSFTYQAQDSTGALGVAATVIVNIAGDNDIPVANDDNVITNEDTAVTIDILANDSDVENALDATSVTAMVAPGKGSISINGTTGKITYTPNADANGSDSFSYVVKDNEDATSNEATVNVTITAVNDAPVVNDDSVANVQEDTVYPINVLGNDTDVENSIDITSVAIVTQPTQGSATVNPATGVISYTPGLNYFGEDSFTYTVQDTDSALSNIASVILTIATVNDMPIANDDIYVVNEDSEDNNFTLLVNDSDIDGTLDSSTLTISENVKNGSLTVNVDGSVDYTPGANYVGDDSFTYTVKDNEDGQTNSATVTITVNNVNDAPTIDSTAATTIDEDEQYSYTVISSDIDSRDSLTYSSDSIIPSWLTLSDLGNGSAALTGTPSNDNVGANEVTIIVVDNDNVQAEQHFTISVANINDDPVITLENSLTVGEDGTQTLAFSYTDIDSESVTAVLKTPAEHGLVSVIGTDISYLPTLNYNGSDSFTLTLTDSDGFSIDKTINVTVSVVNDEPIAEDDQLSVVQTVTNQYQLAVLDNDSDIDADPLTIISASAEIGAVSVVDNQLLYQAEQGFIGTVHLEYLIGDGQQGKDKANVSLTITGAPAKSAPEITLPDDIEVNATGLFTKIRLGVATAIDYSGNPVAVSLVDGKIMYSPGTHKAYWQAIDSQGNKSVATQNILVHPLVSIGKDQTVVEGNKVEVKVILNGNSPSYPVVVPFSVSGSALAGEDHDLVAGEAIIDSSNEALITFNVFTDSVVDAQETIQINLSDTVNSSKQATQTITISEGNVPPEVTLLVEQAQQQRLLLTQDGGDVTISAQVNDANKQDGHSYQWASSNDALQALLNNDDTASISIAVDALAVGVYPISLSVTDDGEPAQSTQTEVYLEITAVLPILTDADSDGDLIPDSQEGYGDQDNDGIPDYQDAISACNVSPEEVSQQKSFLVEGEAGVCLRKGASSAGNESGGSLLTEQDLANSIGSDTEAINVGGIFDYIAYGLPQVGQVYRIVLPQRLPIPADAIYRKYSKIAGWTNYVEDADNTLLSSPGNRGYCPPPQDVSWRTGLNAGDWCVQLMLNDGGPNDNDGLANGTIVDPGGVSVYRNGNNMPTAQDAILSTLWNNTLIIDVVDMISDQDGDSLTIANVSADFGTASIDGLQISYVPAATFVGDDTLVYSVSDGNGGTASGTIIVTVTAYQEVVVKNQSKSGGAISLWILLLIPLAMIRKQSRLIALLLFANLLSLPVKADWGIGGKYGQSIAEVNQGELNQQLTNLNADAQVTSLDDKGSGWGIDAIYRFEEGPAAHWLVTLGYQNLGTFGATITGQAIQPEEFNELVAGVQPQSAEGWTTSVGYQFMLSERFFAQGQLGLFNWKSKSAGQLANYPSTHIDDSGHDLFYGIELGYKLLDNWEASILYQHYKLDKNDVELLGVGLKYYY